MDGKLISTDSRSSYTCSLDNKKYTNGAHTLKARVTDSANQTAEDADQLQIIGRHRHAVTGSGSAPTLAFTAPSAGGVLKGNVEGPPNCTVTGTNIARIMFYLNDVWTNTDGNASNGWGCWLDTTKYQDGGYTVKAVAYNAAGQTTTVTHPVTIQNGTGGSGQHAADRQGIILAGLGRQARRHASYAATATDNGAVAKVDVYVIERQHAEAGRRPRPPRRTAAPSDTTGLANGSAATLMAVATDNPGATSTDPAQRHDRATPLQPEARSGRRRRQPAPRCRRPTPRRSPTFESLGLYWKPGTNPGAAGCEVRYRKTAESAGSRACRCGTTRATPSAAAASCTSSRAPSTRCEMDLPGQRHRAASTSRPGPRTSRSPRPSTSQSGSGTLNITEGGTPSGYVRLRGRRRHARRGERGELQRHRHGAVRDRARPDAEGREAGRDPPRAERARRGDRGQRHQRLGPHARRRRWAHRHATPASARVLQHAATSSSASPSSATGSTTRATARTAGTDGHPAGAAGDRLQPLRRQPRDPLQRDVQRPTASTSTTSSAARTTSPTIGFPNADSDIYGNSISHAWDDGIEAEGAQQNVRIWGNYIDQTAIGIATTVTHVGPVYIFRNVYNRSRMLSQKPRSTTDDRQHVLQVGHATPTLGDGRRYVFHNTMLQATPVGRCSIRSARGGGIVGRAAPARRSPTRCRATTSCTSGSRATTRSAPRAARGNDFDYDLRNGGMSGYAGAEANGIVGTPIYKSGHGWQSEAGGNYQLDAQQPGLRQGPAPAELQRRLHRHRARRRRARGRHAGHAPGRRRQRRDLGRAGSGDAGTARGSTPSTVDRRHDQPRAARRVLDGPLRSSDAVTEDA